MTGISRDRLDQIIATSLFKTTLGGEVRKFGSGMCELYVPLKQEHRQFLGVAHGGIVGALGDDACAWACASVCGELVTATYTINFLAGASGQALVARGQLVKHGRRIAVGRAEVLSIAAAEEVLVAVFQGTMAVRSTP
jgi:uncharacterized protein (TIGR00369 family)